MIDVRDGKATFTVTKKALEQFRVGESIDLNVEGQRVAGTVTKAELGSLAGIVVVELPANGAA